MKKLLVAVKMKVELLMLCKTMWDTPKHILEKPSHSSVPLTQDNGILTGHDVYWLT